MIVSTLENWSSHFDNLVWEKVFNYIATLGPDSSDGITELMGRDIYARVMSYDTVEPTESKVEAHRLYIDIQCSLAYGERIDWFPLEGLKPVSDYNPEKDTTNYSRPSFVPASVCVMPGMFAVFFPEDAHMPKLIIDQSHTIKKVVVKLHTKLLRESC